MASYPLYIWFYLTPLLIIWGVYLGAKKRNEKNSLKIREKTIKEKIPEPSTLHPVINHNRCVGCGCCVKACPENNVLGIIGGKSYLIKPDKCIGHGVCKVACTQNAITLVFGTKERGVDIPDVKSNFETNIPGIFIAGELGGMGLICNAIKQGRKAIESISSLNGVGKGERLDVVIIGAGPAGFSASLEAMSKGMRFVTLEQEALGGTVSHFPRGKVVMTAPVEMSQVGQVNIRETTKEDLLDFWTKVEMKTGIKINYKEKADKVKALPGGFEVKTSLSTYETRAILLAIGLRGTPRKLGVPGEESTKVVYRLIDSEQYVGQHVLVVGGGDSALEAACAIAKERDTTVTISYRSGSFSRAKEKNRKIVEELEDKGELRVLLKSNVLEIRNDEVDLDVEGEKETIKNDGVIVCAGGIMPTGFLKELGVKVETKYGTP